MKVLNAFSFNMVSAFPIQVNATELTADETSELIQANGGVDSCVGHADTAAVFSSELGLHVNANRVSISLEAGDRVVVGQYSGPRLEEGTTNLPEGATIKWLLIEVAQVAVEA